MKNNKLNILVLIGIGLVSSSFSTVLAESFKARLEWSGRVTLSPLVSGYISAVNVVPGDRIKKGVVLMKLVPDAYQADIDHFAALLKSNKSILNEAKRELERSEEMYERTLLSDHDLQLDKNAFILASANYQSNVARLKRARIKLQHSINKAPFDAVVLSRNAEIGQSVFPDLLPEKLMVIAEDGVMLAASWVSETQASKINAKDKISVQVQGNTHNGKVLYIGLEPKSSDEPLYKMMIKFNTEGHHYRAGVLAEVRTGDL